MILIIPWPHSIAGWLCYLLACGRTCSPSIRFMPGIYQSLEIVWERTDTFRLLTQVMHQWKERSKRAIVVPPVGFFDKVSSGCSRSTEKGHHYVLVREGLLSPISTGTKTSSPDLRCPKLSNKADHSLSCCLLQNTIKKQIRWRLQGDLFILFLQVLMDLYFPKTVKKKKPNSIK